MLLKRFRHAALAAAAAAASSAPAAAAQPADDTPSGQSTFVSPGRDLAFAFTVPQNDNSDVFFSLRVPVENSWGAVGLGSDDMKGALFLMVYRNARGDNVTFSPRLAYGNYEPQHYPELQYEALPGTGIVDGHMVFTARCSQHCRSWPAADSNSGYIDVSSPNQKAVYALGPREDFGSNSPAADLKFHREFGVFTMDMKRTLGSPDAPLLDDASPSVGTSLDYRKTGRSDYHAALHGTFMVFFIAFMLPLGAALRRLGRWARLHAVNQSVAVAGVLAGLATGVLASLHYQRSRHFDSLHQVLGFVVVGFIVAQVALGFRRQQQQQHGKTQAPGRTASFHKFLGWVIVVAGTMNAFFGFEFALDAKLGFILAGLLIVIAFATLFITLGRKGVLDRNRRRAAGSLPSDPPEGYQAQPWRQDGHGASPSAYPHDPPPDYEAPSQSIGLQPVSTSPSPWKRSDVKDAEDDHPALGSVQRPREFA